MERVRLVYGVKEAAVEFVRFQRSPWTPVAAAEAALCGVWQNTQVSTMSSPAAWNCNNAKLVPFGGCPPVRKEKSCLLPTTPAAAIPETLKTKQAIIRTACMLFLDIFSSSSINSTA
jgi:hypothetical protein